MTAALEVRGLSKWYGGVAAVDEVDLTLEHGEIVALVGPSGCGKSTMIRLITGLVEPDAGTVVLAGEEVHGRSGSRPPEGRGIGVVFQDHSLFPHLDIAANIAFGLHRRSAAERRSRVQEVLALVDLPGVGERYPHELSGGERQRIGLARALAPQPDLICLDEPFASLDPALRQRVRSDVVEILRDAGAAALLVTHDQIEAMAMGDRVAVMKDGRLMQVGSPDTVFTSPTSRFVAEFLGEADFLPAWLQSDGTTMTEVGVCRSPDAHLVGDPGTLTTIMVRPHEVVVTPDRDGDVMVSSTEFRGGHVLLVMQLPSGRRLRALVPHTEAMGTGDRVSVSLEHGHAPAVLMADGPAS
ncbi:ABC transporter ATP-binding protein [Euzebya tangerina]|uniref:ABC transporter ATP-binding protein n=1 Tax=Euzebya tangerina TaxID=591198 RepID=UPI000E31C193|nr:ABC transporter ATP-binding protein [Euzebya tangerina]